MTALPYIKDTGDRRELIVDGEPFLILGFQWSCDLSSDEDFVERYMPIVREMGCNTAVIPLYWKDVEPRPGEYRLDDLRRRILACREHGLRMVVLWFGAYKNGQMWYAPQWVYDDVETYPRAVRADGEMHQRTACPLGAATLERDKAAFLHVMEAIKDVDAEEHTVIMVQIENEAGLLTGARCYCNQCTQRYQEEGWQDAEDFTATYIARYIEQIAEAGKALYSLPFYANAWLDNVFFGRAGADYPSGGPNMRNLAIYAQEASHLDFVAPDTYSTSDRTFGHICRTYAAGTPVLYIAEHSSRTRLEKNIFYVIGEHGGIGFDPYCINNNEGRPAVSLDLVLDERLQPYVDSLKVINDAMPAILEARQTDRLKCFVQEEADRSRLLSLGGYTFFIRYGDGGRGMLIQLDEGEYLILGCEINVSICDTETGEEVVPTTCEWGRYEDGQWKRLYVANRETMFGYRIPFAGPSVARITLDEDSERRTFHETRHTQ